MIALPSHAAMSSRSRCQAGCRLSLAERNDGSSRTMRLDQRWSCLASPGISTPWRETASRLPHRMVWRYVVAVFGRPMWKKTFDAIDSEGPGVLLDRCRDLLL